MLVNYFVPLLFEGKVYSLNLVLAECDVVLGNEVWENAHGVAVQRL